MAAAAEVEAVGGALVEPPVVVWEALLPPPTPPPGRDSGRRPPTASCMYRHVFRVRSQRSLGPLVGLRALREGRREREGDLEEDLLRSIPWVWVCLPLQRDILLEEQIEVVFDGVMVE